MINCVLWGLAVAMLVGFALPRRYRDWPAAIVLATIGAVLIAIGAIRYLVPVIGGTLAAPAEFIAVHQDLIMWSHHDAPR